MPPPGKFRFVHYGNKYGFSHRDKSKSLDASSDRNERNKRKLSDQKQRREERQRPAISTQKTLQENLEPAALIDPLTSFKRDQFLSYPVQMNTNEYRLESEWFSIFQNVMYLPQVRPTSRIARPQEKFFSSALTSGPAYESLIMLPAAGARVEESGNETVSLNHDLLRLQAKALHSYRSTLTRLQETQSASRADFEILYAITFAFMDGKFAREQAYNAVQLSNLFLVLQFRDTLYMHIPIADWIATIMPVPGRSFKRDDKYKGYMMKRTEDYIKFVADAQAHAQAEILHPKPFHRAALRPGTALRRVLTAPLYDTEARQPYPAFFKFCRVRALNLIWAHLLDTSGRTSFRQFFDALEVIAEESLTYEGSQAMSLFLWGLFSYAHDNQNTEISRLDEYVSVPSKYLLAVRGISFAAEMVAWLLQVRGEDGEVKLPLLDFDAIRQSFAPS